MQSETKPAALLRGEYELVHVTAVFRHGARAPISNCDKEGVNDISWGLCDASARMSAAIEQGHDEILRLVQHGDESRPPRPSAVDASQRLTVLDGGCRCGELTVHGYAQAERLGIKLRELYGAVEPEFLQTRTTHVARCVLSLRGVLSTLVKKQTQKVQIPALTCHASDEWLTPSVRGCPRLGELWAQLKKDNAGYIRTLLQPLTKKMPEQIQDIYKLPNTAIPLKDVLISRRGNALSMPWGIDDEFISAVDNAAAEEVTKLVGSPNNDKASLLLLQLVAGRLVHDIRSHLFQQVTRSEHRHPTIRLISAHDTTILPLLVALGIYDNRWPPFCACCTIELYKNKHDHEFYVRVCYNGATSAHIAAEAGYFYVAKSILPFQEFIALLENIVLTEDEYQAACTTGNTSTSHSPISSSPTDLSNNEKEEGIVKEENNTTFIPPPTHTKKKYVLNE